MSQEKVKQSIAEKKVVCPSCKQPIKKFEKYSDLITSIWDGFGDSKVEINGCRVTLICGNNECKWSERTEYWENYLLD